MLMNLVDYLCEIPSKEEKTRRLLKLFYSLWCIHNYNINKTELYKTNPGYYLTQDLRDIEVNEEGLIDVNKLGNYSIGKIVIDQETKKLDSSSEEGIKWDIIELCIIGICAYNNHHDYFRFRDYQSSINFINTVQQNLERYIEKEQIPDIMKEYFYDVFERKHYAYANDYFEKNYEEKEANSGEERARVKTKSTAQGRMMSAMYEDREAAYVDVLLVPAIITLIYLVVLVASYIFFG